MNIISTGKLLNYRDFLKYGSDFWETGSAAGEGIQRALDAGYGHVWSVEAQEEWYNVCKERFKDNPKVDVMLGKSTDLLKNDVFKHFASRPCVIFLDAHSSGEKSYGHKECVSGEPEFQQENIIKEELGLILSNFKEHVIIIDDVNGLTDGFAEQYADIMLKANPKYKFFFYDENLSGKAEYYYKDKILVAIP